MALRSRFESPEKLLTLFNPKNQLPYTQDQRRAYRGQAPTLGIVSKAFSYGTATSWLEVQLFDLAEFSGCKQKLTLPQIQEVADIIMKEYGYLKLTEMMDFFRRFKRGDYGKFYGAVDPLTITCALREFLVKRNEIVSRYEAIEKAEEAKRDPENIRYRQAYKRLVKKKEFYSFNLRSKDFSYEEFEEIWWLFNLGYERQNHGYIG